MPFNHFDHVAGIYGRAADFKLTKEITQLLSLSPDSNVLDVGGGAGRVAAPLRPLARRVAVADPSLPMLRFARQKQLDSICSTAERLPFVSDSFDRLILVDTLHHIQDQSRAAEELLRVLTKRGKVLIIEPDIDKSIVKLIALMEKVLLMHSHFLSAEKIQRLFEREGVRSTSLKVDYYAMTLVEKVREV